VRCVNALWLIRLNSIFHTFSPLPNHQNGAEKNPSVLEMSRMHAMRVKRLLKNNQNKTATFRTSRREALPGLRKALWKFPVSRKH
jgi:hypothetical protein